RLAVDEALERKDARQALSRAVRGHVPRSEVAARALLLERPELAASIAASVLAAEPRSTGALMVKQAVRGQGAPLPSGALASPADEPPEACVLVYLLAFAADQREPLRAWLTSLVRTPQPPHDVLAAPAAAVLVSRGLVTESDLSEPLVRSLAATKARADGR
ncbi:MAG: Tetratricopeptide 2 repeat protein, partial [Labilithrix sp.]|nr:Tetratricopeptide 2 repeat protein [Labilithrix sp.]